MVNVRDRVRESVRDRVGRSVEDRMRVGDRVGWRLWRSVRDRVTFNVLLMVRRLVRERI